MVNTLLADVGRAHPQALIYPLTVASKSESHIRKNAAILVMDRLRDHSTKLVEQACGRLSTLCAHMTYTTLQSLTVSNELIRVAMLWHELWHEHLEEASRLYFTEKNPDAMITHLESLHRLMEQVSLPVIARNLLTPRKGPQTSGETAFLQVYGKDLREARESCLRFRRYRDNAEMDKAWETYYGVPSEVNFLLIES
jgi:serine/threonine-protein kinase mTOR